MRRLPFWLVAAGDILVFCAGLFLAFLLRFGGKLPPANLEAFYLTLPWIALTVVPVFAAFGLYRLPPYSFSAVVRSLLPALAILWLAAVALAFWVRGFAFPRSVFLLGTLLQLGGCLGWRWCCHRWNQLLHGERRLLMIAGREGEKLVEKLPVPFFRVKRVVEEGRFSPELLEEVEGVMVAPEVSPKLKAEVLAACLAKQKEIYLVPELYEVMLTGAAVEELSDLPVLRLEGLGLSPTQLWFKRLIDLCLASCLLILTSPLFLLLALAIKLSSPGPVFYAQERVGQHGRVFRLLKFRTMIPEAEKDTGPVLSCASDPRVTRVGRWLRASRLDELPQLLNVLKGEMSLVGPRPERPVFVAEYARKHPAYWLRHVVKPGLTGLAQISGCYTTSPEDKLRFDLYYIRNYSLWLDLKIILRTLPVLLNPQAAMGKASSQSGQAFDR